MAFLRQRITIKRPVGKRKSFALVLDQTDMQGVRRQETIINEDLSNINESLASGTTDFNHASYLIEELREKLLKKYRVDTIERGQVSKVNAKIFKKFWEERYEDRDDLKDTTLKTSRYKFMRILRVMDDQSLLTIDKKEAKKRLEKEVSSTEAYNGIIKDFNQLAKHIGRNFTLPKKRVRKREPIFITEEQLQQLLGELKTQFDKDAVVVMYYTGVRTGELFALSEESFRGETRLFIAEQMDKDHSYDDPKNGKRRKTIVYPKGREALERWVYDYDIQKKRDSRDSLTKRVTEAALRAFRGRLKAKIAGTTRKNISNHVMRHSFAKLCINGGSSISDVAMLIGDSVEVAQENYIGWILEDDALQRIEDKLNF